MSTSLDDLLETLTNQELAITLTEEKLTSEPQPFNQQIFDFSLSQETRMEALYKYYQDDPENVIEIIRKINSIYSMSSIGLLKRFLTNIASQSTLPVTLKIDCCLTLINGGASQKTGFECLDKLVGGFGVLPTPCQFEYLIMMVNYKDAEDLQPLRKHIQTVYDLLDNPTIDVEWRFRILQHLNKSIHTDSMETLFIGLLRFMLSPTNNLRFRILAAQHILSQQKSLEQCQSNIPKVFKDYLQYDTTTVELYDSICLSETPLEKISQNFLTEIMENTDYTDNQRADSADVLLHYGSDEYNLRAREILHQLGGTHFNIYENLQNVHNETINQGVLDALQFLDTLRLDPLPSFDSVSYNIKHNIRSLSFEDEIKVSEVLLRIDLDRTVFPVANYTLKSILIRIFAYSFNHQHKTSLLHRLLEEMLDMAGTCSSGYSSRLVNTLSGFGEFSLHISWQEQITANLSGRLNARLKKEETRVDDILEQMINKKLGDRTAFLEFFIKHLPSVKEEMYQEFCDHLSDSDWDTYFHNAILTYTEM